MLCAKSNCSWEWPALAGSWPSGSRANSCQLPETEAKHISLEIGNMHFKEDLTNSRWSGHLQFYLCRKWFKMDQSIFVLTPKSSNIRKLQRLRVKSNHVLFLLMVTFLFLYVRDHVRLIEVQEALDDLEGVEEPQNHWLVMEERKKSLKEQCKKFAIDTRIEHSSLFHRWECSVRMNHSKSLRTEPVNRCTGRFFKFDEKDFFICNVLKGGSTSWSFFFGENNITAAFIADCRESGSCPEKPELRLLQVDLQIEK